MNNSKKKWVSPEFYLLSTDTIAGGAAPGVHEGHITHTVKKIGFYNLHFAPSSYYIAHHKKSYYAS